jgi:hypothetical protein
VHYRLWCRLVASSRQRLADACRDLCLLRLCARERALCVNERNSNATPLTMPVNTTPSRLAFARLFWNLTQVPHELSNKDSRFSHSPNLDLASRQVQRIGELLSQSSRWPRIAFEQRLECGELLGVESRPSATFRQLAVVDRF